MYKLPTALTIKHLAYCGICFFTRVQYVVISPKKELQGNLWIKNLFTNICNLNLLTILMRPRWCHICGNIHTCPNYILLFWRCIHNHTLTSKIFPVRYETTGFIITLETRLEHCHNLHTQKMHWLSLCVLFTETEVENWFAETEERDRSLG